MMTSSHVTNLDSVKSCSSLCVASSASLNCDAFAWKKGTCHVGNMLFANQTSVTGAAMNEYKLYIGKDLLKTKFRKMSQVPSTLWTSGVTVSLADTLSGDDCASKCYLDHDSTCLFYTYEALTNLCHIGDLAKKDSATSITPVSPAQDLYLRIGYASHKGKPNFKIMRITY